MFHIDLKLRMKLEPERIATELSVYLLGVEALHNRDGNLGPHRKKEGDDNHWQLDHTNDFWLHVEPELSEVKVVCRNDWDRAVLEAVVALFKSRHQHLIAKEV